MNERETSEYIRAVSVPFDEWLARQTDPADRAAAARVLLGLNAACFKYGQSGVILQGLAEDIAALEVALSASE